MNLFLPASPFDLVGSVVRAKHAIQDNPLAREDCSARSGASGEVVDYDRQADLYFVDFGKGAIACSPNELTV